MAKVMSAKDFAKKAKDIATKYKTLYIMGCFGSPMTSTNKKRYTKNHSYNKQSSRTTKINSASSNTFGFDCVCLIKGILWGWNGNNKKTYGGAIYTSNGVADIGANRMIKSEYCSDVSTNFKNIKVGEVVWMDGHIGIYIGDGLVVESTPIWKDGVQITALKNLGAKKGYNNRTWTKHGKLKYIDYSEAEEKAEEKPKVEKYVPKVGDYVVPIKLVNYKGKKLIQYDKKYQILEINKNGALLGAVRGKQRPIWATLKLDNLKEVK